MSTGDDPSDSISGLSDAELLEKLMRITHALESRLTKPVHTPAESEDDSNTDVNGSAS